MSSHRNARPSRPLPPAPPPPSISRNSNRTKSDEKEKSPTKRRSRSRSRSRERYLRTRQDNSRGSNRRRSASPRTKSRSRSPVREKLSREHESASRNRSSTVFSGAGVPSSSVHSGSSHTSLEPSSSRMATAAPGSSLLLTSDFAPIIRAITNPEDVKIPRRLTEGIRPIFDRTELREAMRRRMQADDNEMNMYPQPSPAPVVEAANQRVVAIIREPVDYLSLANAPSASAAPVGSVPHMMNSGLHSIHNSSGFNPSPPMPSRGRSPSTSDEPRARRISPDLRGSDRIERASERISSRRPSERGRDRERSMDGDHPCRSKSVIGRWVRDRSPMRNSSPPPSRPHPHEHIREHPRGHREVRMSPPPFNHDLRDRHVFVDNDGNRRHSPDITRRPRPRSKSPEMARRHNARTNARTQGRDLRNTLSRPPKNLNRFEIAIGETFLEGEGAEGEVASGEDGLN